jgi:predicted ATPase
MNNVTELLKIDNFLSIKNFEWKIEDFNVITGDMGSGKSLCIKLLKFFEDIIPNLLVLPYEQFLSNLEYDFFLKRIKRDFGNVFYFPSDNSKGNKIFNIEYIFMYETQKIEINIRNDTNGDVIIKSNFLEELLSTWKEYLAKQKNVTPDGFGEVKLFLHNDLQKKFGNHFPGASIFIPASRAALAFGSISGDSYLKDYNELINILKRVPSQDPVLTNSILKAKVKRISGNVWLESSDGRRVPISKASSGQQEIIFVLMILDKLGNFQFSYGKDLSLFVEEPSAHLFPLEQKQTIEYIVLKFNKLKEEKNAVRFFITTHSPYILNSLNNILKKGSLIEKYDNKKDEIDNVVEIPYLFAKDISAYFIDGNGVGKTMIDEKEKYIYDDKIAEISYFIDEDARKLSELKNEFLNAEVQID